MTHENDAGADIRRMGAPTGPRAKNAAETRERILVAARIQFAGAGYAGARIDAICREARVNTRMIYHYFGDKAGLYVAVLEDVLGKLRIAELTMEVPNTTALDGLLRMFDFSFRHFAAHPELITLLSGENLLRAEFLKSSTATPIMSSPVIAQIRALLDRGAEDGTVRPSIDPLHLYVVMVGLAYFHRSNGHTLSIIFKTDVLSDAWGESHRQFASDMLKRFLSA